MWIDAMYMDEVHELLEEAAEYEYRQGFEHGWKLAIEFVLRLMAMEAEGEDNG